MTANEISAFITAGAALVGSVAGVSLSVYLTRDKFARERTWEQRKDCYSRIIAGTMKAHRQTISLISYYQEDPDGQRESEWRDKLETDLWQGWRELIDLYHGNEIIMSDAFSDRFWRLESDLAALPDLEPGDDHHEHYLAVLRTFDRARGELRLLGRQEVLTGDRRGPWLGFTARAHWKPIRW